MPLGENYINFTKEERIDSFPYQIFVPVNSEHTIDEIHVNMRRVDGANIIEEVPIYRLGDLRFSLNGTNLEVVNDNTLIQSELRTVGLVEKGRLGRPTLVGAALANYSNYGIVRKKLKAGSTIKVTALLSAAATGDIGDYEITLSNLDGTDVKLVTNTAAIGATMAFDVMGTVTLLQDWDGIIWRYRRIDTTEDISLWQLLFEINSVPFGSVSMSIHDIDEHGIPYPTPIDNGQSTNSFTISGLTGVSAVKVFDFNNCLVENKPYAVRFNISESGWSNENDYVVFGVSEYSESNRFSGSLQFLGNNNKLLESVSFLSADIYYTPSEYPPFEFIWPCAMEEQSAAILEFIDLVQTKIDTINSLSLKALTLYSDNEPFSIEMWELEWENSGETLPIPSSALLLWYNTELDTFGGSFRVINDTLVRESHPYSRGMTFDTYYANSAYFYRLGLMGMEMKYSYTAGNGSGTISATVVSINALGFVMGSTDGHDDDPTVGYSEQSNGTRGQIWQKRIDPALSGAFVYHFPNRPGRFKRLNDVKLISHYDTNTFDREVQIAWYRQ